MVMSVLYDIFMIMLVFPCAYNASQSDSKLTIFLDCCLLGPYYYSYTTYYVSFPRIAGPTNELTGFTVTGTDNMACTVSHKGLPGMRPIVNDLSATSLLAPPVTCFHCQQRHGISDIHRQCCRRPIVSYYCSSYSRP